VIKDSLEEFDTDGDKKLSPPEFVGFYKSFIIKVGWHKRPCGMSACLCVCERERERERVCVCVCARARTRMHAYVCVCTRIQACSVWTCTRDSLRVCVCICVRRYTYIGSGGPTVRKARREAKELREKGIIPSYALRGNGRMFSGNGMWCCGLKDLEDGLKSAWNIRKAKFVKIELFPLFRVNIPGR
jgi:hypothetical protein